MAGQHAHVVKGKLEAGVIKGRNMWSGAVLRECKGTAERAMGWYAQALWCVQGRRWWPGAVVW